MSRIITVPETVTITIGTGTSKFSIFDIRRNIWRSDPRFSTNFAAIEMGMKIATAFDEAEKAKSDTITIDSEEAWTLLDQVAREPHGGYLAYDNGKVIGGIGADLYPIILAVKNATPQP